MPKTSVHENNRPEFGKDNVGATREIFFVKSKTVSHTM